MMVVKFHLCHRLELPEELLCDLLQVSVAHRGRLFQPHVETLPFALELVEGIQRDSAPADDSGSTPLESDREEHGPSLRLRAQ